MTIVGPTSFGVEWLLQALFIVSIVGFSTASILRSGKLLNPVTVMSGCFFLPAFFAMFRLSSLQSREWAYETYALLLQAYVVWLLLPFVVLMVMPKYAVADSPRKETINLVGTPQFLWLTRGFAMVVVLAYLAGNYLQTGLVIPLVDPESAYQAHAEFPFFLRFFARANPAAAGLLFLCFFVARSKWDLGLLAIVAIVPLSRLSRIDPALTLFVLLVLNGVYPVVRFRWRSSVVIGLVGMVIILGGTALGHERTNRFGTYDVKYEDAIGWTPKWKGPLAVLPTAYGYFPLSFENLDRFVRENPDKRTYGLFTFDWLFTGFVKLNWFVGLDRIKARAGQFTPVSTGANVPTAVFPFFADCGAAWAWAPMAMYMAFWLFLYSVSRTSPVGLVLYALYTAGFGLSAFQAIISAPILIQQLAEVALLFFLARRMSSGTAGAVRRQPRRLAKESSGAQA